MADNIPNVSLEAGEPIDLYDATGIAVGTQIEVQNIGAVDVLLFSQLDLPEIDDGQQLLQRGEYMENEEDDLGAWALSRHSGGVLSVKVAT